jgi:hypothetical protein
MAAVATDVLPIAIAEAVPIFPPRPDAIVTLLTTDDFLSGAQTLLYSIKVRSMGTNGIQSYEPA